VVANLDSSVLLRCKMEGELSDEGLVQATERLDEALDGINLVELTPQIKRRAMEAFPIHVKTLDALHISTALELRAEALHTVVSFTGMNAGSVELWNLHLDLAHSCHHE
jgi:hypothetical protein